jgi:hypothetical protein
MPVDPRKPASASVAAKPSPKRTAGKGAPPPQADTLGALGTQPAPGDGKRRGKAEAAKSRKAKSAEVPAKERTEPLNFRVTPDLRRAFKRAAAAQDCKKVELLERIFAEWNERNPA